MLIEATEISRTNTNFINLDDFQKKTEIQKYLFAYIFYARKTFYRIHSQPSTMTIDHLTKQKTHVSI